jgi:hypothetical protein
MTNTRNTPGTPAPATPDTPAPAAADPFSSRPVSSTAATATPWQVAATLVTTEAIIVLAVGKTSKGRASRAIKIGAPGESPQSVAARYGGQVEPETAWIIAHAAATHPAAMAQLLAQGCAAPRG